MGKSIAGKTKEAGKSKGEKIESLVRNTGTVNADGIGNGSDDASGVEMSGLDLLQLCSYVGVY
jgi:hypothetical protein